MKHWTCPSLFFLSLEELSFLRDLKFDVSLPFLNFAKEEDLLELPLRKLRRNFLVRRASCFSKSSIDMLSSSFEEDDTRSSSLIEFKAIPVDLEEEAVKDFGLGVFRERESEEKE